MTADSTMTNNSIECRANCPSFAPYVHNVNYCLPRCPSGTYKLSGSLPTCVQACDKLFVINASNNFSKECVLACPSTLQTVNENECTVTCVVPTPFVSASGCVAACPNATFIEVAGVKKCVEKCPMVFAIVGTSKQCKDVCLATEFVQNGQCVTACITGMFTVNDT